MKKLLLVGTMIVIAAPAHARDGQPYFGVSGGIMAPKTNQADVLVDFTTTQTPTTPSGPAVAGDTILPGAIRVDYKRGYDLDAVAGYDFGIIRGELELGYKRAKLEEYRFGAAELAALSIALNRPSAAPDPFAPGFAALATDNVDGRVTVMSAMANALLDIGGNDGLGFFAGGGFGRARVKLLGNRDDAWAYQALAGVRYPVSDNIDFGIKYRYFRTARLSLSDDEVTLVQGNPDLLNLGTTASPIFVERRTTAGLNTDFGDRFSSHSLLASLTFNFGGRSAAPMMAPAPMVEAAPPPPPPPATQTCYDGTVILATDNCPQPPAPPPPPPPAPVRG